MINNAIVIVTFGRVVIVLEKQIYLGEKSNYRSVSFQANSENELQQSVVSEWNHYRR